MKKLTILSLAALAATTTFTGCNSDSPVYESEIVYNVGVSSFELKRNDSVLANLDTVFFSIDLEKALIFNADSLPFGTRTDSLVPVITPMGQVTKAELRFKQTNGRDTVFNYIEDGSRTVNFSNGPVYFTIAASDTMIRRTYTIQVNVHKVKSDSLVWSETARTALPTTLSAPKQQKTVRNAAGTYTLTTDGSQACIAVRKSVLDAWETYAATLPASASVNSFAATDDALYILSGNSLYVSKDGGRTWTATGSEMNHVYGGYGTRLLGAVNKNNEWYTTEYPGGALAPLPEGMPVYGTSQMIKYSFDLGTAPVSTFVGGRDADDVLTGASWAFDGSEWACISIVPVDTPLEDATLVPFFTFSVNDVFVVSRQSVFLAFGGSDGDGYLRTVYVSGDYGRTWKKGGESIQLPDYIPSMYGAQAYVENITMHSRAENLWTAFTPSYRIPGTAVVSPFELPMSRATEPVSEWECPYIYLYGGMTRGSVLSQYVWRGTINRMTFKPIL